MNDQPIVNRVANSPIVSLDLSEYRLEGERCIYDLKDNLFQGLILREKNLRTFLSAHDWAQYAGKHIAIQCTADAIVPAWASMLLTTYLAPHAASVVYGDLAALEQHLTDKMLTRLDLAALENRPVVVKGCGDLPNPDYAYVRLTQLLLPVVRALMFGEPCSTVPLYKRKVSK